MTFTIKHFTSSDGERFSQLYEKGGDGFPLYYPTAYIARSVRPSTTHATQLVYLEAIKRVCEWEKNREIVLATRFQRREFLKQPEIDCLVRRLTASRKSGHENVISRQKSNTYIVYAAKYLRWLAVESITEVSADIKASIDRQHKQLESTVARKRGSSSASKQRILAKRLLGETTKVLIGLFNDPLQGVIKNGDKGPRIRNIIMLRILYETGMRRGELLSLKIQDFVESIGGASSQLRIERNHNDRFDSRVRQPVVKSLGRIVNISAETEQQLFDYLCNWRPSTDSEFIFVNHRLGRSHGKPVSETGFNSAMEQLKKSFPPLAPLHPHLLRHDWNYRFSQKSDLKKLDFETERTIREMLMGWRPNSEMSLLYNLRHIQEKMLRISSEIASDTTKKD